MGSAEQVEVFVTELTLEPEGSYAVGCSKALRQALHGGGALTAAQVVTLLDVVRRSGDAEVRSNVIHALVIQALRLDDGAILESVATLGSGSLRTSLAADVRIAIGPHVLAAWLTATHGQDDALAQKLANRLGNSILVGADISAASERLTSLLGIAPKASGSKRVVVSAAARECIFAALTQNNPQRRKGDASLGQFVDRAALEHAAADAFLPLLEAAIAEANARSHDARLILVAVAAAKEQWSEVDARSQTNGKSGAALAIANGLLMATRALTFVLAKSDATDTHRAFVREIARRISRLRAELRKADLAEVDAGVEQEAAKVRLRLETAPDDAALVSALLAAPEKKRRSIELKLLERVRDDPAVAKLLPALDAVPKTGPRIAIGHLQLLALRPSGDLEAMRSHFALLRKLGMSITAALSTLANSSKPGRASYVPLVAPLLEDENPAIRWWACYFLRNAAAEENVELADWAEAMVSRIVDSARPPGNRETVAIEARRALKHALTATKRKSEFVTAARQLLERSDAKTKTALSKQLHEIFPEVLE